MHFEMQCNFCTATIDIIFFTILHRGKLLSREIFYDLFKYNNILRVHTYVLGNVHRFKNIVKGLPLHIRRNAKMENVIEFNFLAKF